MSVARIVSVSAPASSANLGAGFDVFALALDLARDWVRVRRAEKGVRVRLSDDSLEAVPEDGYKNTCGVVALEIIREFGIKAGIYIELSKRIPVGVGLGSSGASAAATALGLNKLFSLGLEDSELVKLAAKGERVSAGTEHRDNVSASLFGGFVLVKPDTLQVLKIDPPPDLGVIVCTPSLPKMERKTEKLRAVLPRNVPLTDVVMNVGNASSMIYGLLEGDIDLIGRSMYDAIVEPARSPFVPGYLGVRKAAMGASASGVAISGAGPSILAIYDKSKAKPSDIATAMTRGFISVGIQSRSYVCRPAEGARSSS